MHLPKLRHTVSTCAGPETSDDQTVLPCGPAAVPEAGGDDGDCKKDSKLSRLFARRAEQRFGTRLASAFALVAAMTAIFGGIFNYAIWNLQFSNYVRSNLQAVSTGVATASAYSYQRFGGWNFSTLTSIPQVGANSDIAVQILNTKGTVIYDEATLRSHISEMQGGMSQDSSATATTSKVNGRPTGEVVTSPVMVNGRKVGTVRVWPYGSTSMLTERDIALRAGSLLALAIAAVVSIIIASISGTLFSRNISRPINKISQTAQAIRKGDLAARTGIEGDDEISLLGVTFDKMADSVENDRMLERRLTSDVAHELRTPLMAIQATVEGMEDGVIPADVQHLDTVRSETRRLSRLTNAILELSRLENGSLPLTMGPLDIAVPVHAAIDAHEALIEASALTLEQDVRSGINVIGDRDRLQQAIGNLLSNAARYTPEGGTIKVSAYAEGPSAVIEVADNGIGISEEDFDKLFRRFWRADAARARQTGGVGVGLSIAKEIVERHDGCIEVSSEPNIGTIFKIRMPRA